jgi:hypothetical protein
VVWVQEDGAGDTPVYLAARDPRGPWTKPADLKDTFSASSGIARGAQAVFGKTGVLYVVWSQRDEGGREAVFAARRGPEGRWLDDGRHPVQLSSPDRSAYGVSIAAGPDRGVLVAWVEDGGPHDRRVAARRSGNDRPWENEERLSAAGVDSVADPSVAMGPGDRAVVAWVQGTPQRVVFARVE